jgi:hypothetical protein
MTAGPLLLGLDRLIATCHRLDLPLELPPPVPNSPKAGDHLFEQPFDPLLAAVFQRAGEATLGTFTLLPPHREHHGLLATNEEFKRDGEEPFRSTLLFAKEDGFLYYYGTVSTMVDSEGLQPVVRASYYSSDMSAVPIASNVDRFFDTYSRYLELMVVDPGYIDTGVTELQFPWGVPKLIAADTALMVLVREGRFSHLMEHDEGAQEWVAELLATP